MMRWEEPPEGAGVPGFKVKYREEAAQLRANPGRWALLAEGLPPRQGYSLADNIRRGMYTAFKPQGSFEARASAGSVWVRAVNHDPPA